MGENFIRAHIRWLIARDMPEVLAIEEHHYSCWESWSEEDFIRCLRQRNCIGLVAEMGEKVVGFMVYELDKHHMDILNMVVHPDYLRHGIGWQMVAKLQDKLSKHRRRHLCMDVRETNLAGLLFLKAQGFQAINILSNRYEDLDEDCIRMAYSLPVPVEEPMVEMAEEGNG